MIDLKRTYLPLSALLIVAVALATSCGKGGGEDEGGGGGVIPPVVTPPALALTEVGIDTMPYRLPGSPSCLKQQGVARLPAVPDGALVDGDLGEWAQTGGLITDSLGDAPTGFDLTTLQAAVDDTKLHMALAGSLAAATSLHIEFGGALVRDAALISDVARVYRLDHGTLQELQNGIWQDLGADGEVTAGPYGIEWSISRRSLGDVVTWPLWWVRFYTVDADGNVKDSTLGTHYRSLLEADHPSFELGGCSQWSGRNLPFSFAHVRDADFTRPTNSPKTGPLAEKAFQLTRMAFNMAAELLPAGEELPVSRLTIIATMDTILTPQTMNGFGGDLAMIDRYRAIRIPLPPLAPGSGVDFPEGDVLRQAGEHLWLLYLDKTFNAAPSYLKAAVATALVDYSLQTYVGTAFYFDRFAVGLAPFLAAPDTESPVPLEARMEKLADPASFSTKQACNVYARQTNAKAVAFGRMLGVEFDARQLLTAWNHAGALAASGRSPVPAFVDAMAATHADRTTRAKVAKMWPGWIQSGAYSGAFAPSAMGDTDLDGVPDRIEVRGGTSPELADTDDNGWNDNTGYILGSLKARKDDVNLIVPDGNFGDWLELMPKRVISDLGRSGVCPKDADINYYSAITSRDELIVGAVANEFWRNDPNARWEVVLDMPLTGAQILISAGSGDQNYVFKNGKTGKKMLTVHNGRSVAGKSIEWVVRRRDLGLAAHFDTLDAVKLRIRTTYQARGKTLFCDETGSFAPNVTQ